MILFDTHAHLDEESFNEIRDEVVQRAQNAGIATIIAVGTTAPTSRICINLTAQYQGIYAAVGIHPNFCAEAAEGDWQEIVDMCDEPKVVALGETGLDRHWDFSPLPLQQDYFDRHLRLSQEKQLPFIVHMRDCDDDILEMLKQAHQRGPLLGVMHSFTGDAALARQCLDLGLYISFAGMVTYKKSDDLRQVAAGIPTDRLLIETDSPYLSPHPRRGQRPNEPALLIHTAQCLADVRSTSLESLAQQTTANACRLFRIDGE